MRKTNTATKNTKTKKKSKGAKKPKANSKKNKFKLLDNLNPLKIPRVRRELLDADYLDKLSEEDLQWYAKFFDEWAGANVKKSKKTKRPLTRHFHRTNKEAKELYDANNRRNNDLYGVAKANNLINQLKSYDEDIFLQPNHQLQEEAMIAKIDNENNILSLEEFQDLKNNLTEKMVEFYEKYYKLIK